MLSVFQHKKTIAGILGCIVFLVIACWDKDSLQNRAIAMALLMVVFWIFEVVPIYVTALIPLVLCTPLSLLDPTELALAYGNNNVYLFLGGFILALALEKWNVHHQIASRILAIMGSTKSKILLGFGLSSYLLSMWISNTATTLMMLPMAISIIQAQKQSEESNRFSLLLMLTVAYAASIGGMATLVGSPPNTQMAGTLESTFGIEISFLGMDANRFALEPNCFHGFKWFFSNHPWFSEKRKNFNKYSTSSMDDPTKKSTIHLFNSHFSVGYPRINC